MDGGQVEPLVLNQNHRSLMLLYAARAARGFGDGFAVIILPAYLAQIGFDAFQIGIVATAALLGTSAATLLIGHLGARHDLRNLLLIGAAFMIGSGLAFPNAQHIALVAAIAFFGTMNPSTGDLGMLVPLEHAMIARSVEDRERTSAFARYSLIGALATAAGALAAAAPDLLGAIGIDRLTALKLLFYGYAALGIVSALLYTRLPHAEMKAQAPQAALGPSRGIVYKMAALFIIAQSLLVLWLFERFDLSLTATGVFFFWSNVLAAFSFPVAARLAKRFGLVNTMVFTHIPSSLCLIVAAFVPNLTIVLALLLIRAALSQMDVPTRTSYVMAVVTPEERPAAASVTAVPRTLTSAISPTIAGALLSTTVAGVPLVICGALKIAYDVALLYSFRHIKPPEEQG
jgi:MFS family permease